MALVNHLFEIFGAISCKALCQGLVECLLERLGISNCRTIAVHIDAEVRIILGCSTVTDDVALILVR